jgi:hypothetical protein
MSRSSPFTIERLELEKALAMMNVFASVPEAINSNKNENIADIIKNIASQKLDSINMDNVRKNIDIYANEIAGKALDKNQETAGGTTTTGATGTGDGNSGFNETKDDILIPTMAVMPQVAQKIAYFDNDIVETYISTDDKNLPKARISQLHSNEELEKTNIEQARVNNQALIDKIVNNIDSSLEREKLINSGAIYSQDMVDQVILEQNKENEHAI